MEIKQSAVSAVFPVKCVKTGLLRYYPANSPIFRLIGGDYPPNNAEKSSSRNSAHYQPNYMYG